MPKEKEDSSCTPTTVGQNREEMTQEQPEPTPTQPKVAENVERPIPLPFPQRVIQPKISSIESAKPLPSVEQPPALELKPLPKHLKYAYLEADEKLPVIISTKLNVEQEEKLLEVIRRHKKAIGWTLADIPGISPSLCMHRILLEEGAKPVRQPQRRLFSNLHST
ncbi:uncharacterized protein LOC113855110 [Abrus precatorius]|uniref:Uncharacterized protein LOC113855110 n=1 Tax=Abrus precatorius TaxID=3816 RepID=A0A8B8KF65_ABRPR|nr:uncharacterized protein LOC113855110 [Abrus precatorius]